MPKKSEATGATAAGLEGIAQDANQRVWELDPERDVNGELLPGDHPDRDESADDEREALATPDDEPRPIVSDANDAAPRSGSKSGDVTESGSDVREDESVASTGASTRSQSPNTTAKKK